MRKQIILLICLLLVALTATSAAVYQNTHKQNVTNAAVVKADKQRDAALGVATAYHSQLQAANTENQSLGTAKSALCQQLVTLKAKSNYCQ
jgi:putative cell wall-binding protein